MQNSYDFEQAARSKFSGLWKVELESRDVDIRGVAKKFDMVSADKRTYVGDAKKLNRGSPTAGPDSGERSFIAEYVWLLQHYAPGEHKFIVFGNDKDDDRIAASWIRKHEPIAKGVDFYFMTTQGAIKHWAKGQWRPYPSP